MNLQLIEIMYQQWQQGNEDYVRRWVDFVEMAAKQTQHTQLELVTALQKTNWFMWTREE
jgi:curli biogenesis system outer membrane secretion channel CsgG